MFQLPPQMQFVEVYRAGIDSAEAADAVRGLVLLAAAIMAVTSGCCFGTAAAKL